MDILRRQHFLIEKELNKQESEKIEILNKSIEDEDYEGAKVFLLLKGKAAAVGETRTWAGKMYKKVAPNKWQEVRVAKGGRKISKTHYTREKNPVLKKFDTAVNKLAKMGAIKPKHVEMHKEAAKNSPESIKISKKLNGAWKEYRSTLSKKHAGEVSKHALTKVGNNILSLSKQLKELHSETGAKKLAVGSVKHLGGKPYQKTGEKRWSPVKKKAV